MNTLLSFLKSLKSLLPRLEPMQGYQEAYLADAVDIYDLERRMRQLDERAQSRSAHNMLGFERG